MDPNETLKEIRQLILALFHEDNDPQVNELIDLVDGLDNWISNGGFLPQSWNRDLQNDGIQKRDKQLSESARIIRALRERMDIKNQEIDLLQKEIKQLKGQ